MVVVLVVAVAVGTLAISIAGGALLVVCPVIN